MEPERDVPVLLGQTPASGDKAGVASPVGIDGPGRRMMTPRNDSGLPALAREHLDNHKSIARRSEQAFGAGSRSQAR